jgi:UDP-glucose 6-dehydrogenase
MINEQSGQIMKYKISIAEIAYVGLLNGILLHKNKIIALDIINKEISL